MCCSLLRLAAEQKARIDSLLQDAAAHRQANDIRAYVAAVRSSTTNKEHADQLEIWQRWALTQADRLDPISSVSWREQSQRLPDAAGNPNDKAN